MLPNGEYVVSESVFGGLWLIGRDGTIRPGLVPDGSGGAAAEARPAARSSGPITPSAACRSRRPANFAPGAGSLAVRGDELYLSSTCAGGVQKLKITTLRDSVAPGRRARRGDRDRRQAPVRPREPEGHHVQRVRPRSDPWIYAGDPFRLQLIRIHSRTGKREVLSTNAKRFNFTVSTTFLPPVQAQGQATRS